MNRENVGQDTVIAYQAICRGLDAMNWKYVGDDENLEIEYYVSCRSGLDYHFRIYVSDSNKLIAVFVDFPFTIPEKMRQAVCEYFSHVNFSLAVGCFELNFLNGEACFSLCTSYSESLIGDKLVKKLNDIASITADGHAPSVKRFLDGEISYDDLFEEEF